MSENANPFSGKADSSGSELSGTQAKPGSPFDDGGTGIGSSEPKKSNKKLIVGIVSAVVALLVVIAVVIVFVVLNQVSPDDYAKAKDKLASIYTLARKDDTGLTSANAYQISGEDYHKITVKSEKRLEEIKDKINELGGMKAIDKDKDAKEKYAKFSGEYNKFAKEAKGSLDTLDQIMPIFLASRKINDARRKAEMGSSEYYEAMAEVFEEMSDKAKQAKLSDDSLSKAIGKVATGAEAYSKYYETLANKGKMEYSQLIKTTQGFYTSLSEVSRKITTIANTLAKASFQNSYNELNDYLSKKAAGDTTR